MQDQGEINGRTNKIKGKSTNVLPGALRAPRQSDDNSQCHFVRQTVVLFFGSSCLSSLSIRRGARRIFRTGEVDHIAAYSLWAHAEKGMTSRKDWLKPPGRYPTTGSRLSAKISA
jgi:hypothetical protein